MRIRILATSDLHINLKGFDYYTDAPEATIGLARTASLIRTARNEAKSEGALVLTFDNGDSLQGTPIGDWAIEPGNGPHILMQAFEKMGYDAIGLGNHDFGYGLEALDRVLAESPCPVVCSNAQRIDKPPTWQSCTILQRTVQSMDHAVQLKIGVLSVLPPQTAKWESHRLQNKVTISDILPCAQKVAQTLRTQGCDLVVALAHTGLGPAKAEPNLENAIIPLAAIDEIDALIAGHSHLTLPGIAHGGFEFVDARRGLVHGKPVVMPGSAGSHLGVIDLTLQSTGGRHWYVQNPSAELRPVHQAPRGRPALATDEDPELARIFCAGHAETRKRAAEPVGHSEHHLHSYFSFCAHDRGLLLVAAAQASALRPYLQNTPFKNLPVLSAVAPSKFGGRAGSRFFTDVPAGQICLRHVVDLYVFPNELQAVVVSAKQIQQWLEMSASVFNQLSYGTQTDLVAQNRAGHNFDILKGLTYQIDLSQPPRFDAGGHLIHPAHHRIRDICLNGHPLEADQRFVVALNNYRANGGGHFSFLEHAERIKLPILSIQEILRDYLSNDLPPDPLETAPQPFRFRPLNGASATLRTGQAARRYLDELDEFNPAVIGEDDAGFLLIRLTL